MSKSCVVVGGGPQGMMLSRVLCKKHGLGPEEMAIVDPSPLGYWWMERLKDCDTLHLRSGPQDHVDCEPSSLLDFAERSGRMNGFARADRRPCVKLFNDHVRMVAAQLEHVHYYAEVTGLDFRPGGGIAVE